MKSFFSSFKLFVATALVAIVLVGCGQSPQPPQPTTLISPTPIMDNTGAYLFPYTQDDVLAEWTDKAIVAEGTSQVSGAVGAYAGSKVMEQIPFIGGFLGNKVGAEIGRRVVIESAGGMEFIKESSDISFNSPKDYCIYAYVKFSSNEHYDGAMKAAYSLYDELSAPICMQHVYSAPTVQ